MIRILPPEEARKIAAGEVIDRPAALVREFTDNALDSGANTIELSIEGGGTARVEVTDDGSGMGREDLELCVKTHATSKIRSLDDLAVSSSLGFRGEALAAAAAVSRLEITSSIDGREAWLLETEPGSEEGRLTQTRRTRGTSARSLGLFEMIPARKRFLKRESSEGALCKQVFTEKAMAFPAVCFRFVQDGRLKLHLSARAGDGGSDLQKRFGELVLEAAERPFLHTAEAAGRGFAVRIVFGGPEIFRRDRRQQFVFANKRRIQDYSLMQALEYGLSGFFPNGVHPVGAVFVDVDPALADFNIHPAKREVRFADAGAVHHCVTGALIAYVRSAIPARPSGQGEDRREPELKSLYGSSAADYNRRLAMEALLEKARCGRDESRGQSGCAGQDRAWDGYTESAYTENAGPDASAEGSAAEAEQGYGTRLRLLGRAFGLFIIVEWKDRLLLIDQHAAHERFLYDTFLSKPIAAQELLVPIPFTTADAGEDRFLHDKKEELARLGIVLENDGSSWRIEALPAGWKTGDGDTVAEILSLKNSGGHIVERWAAALACRGAVKDGGWLDDAAALALAESALALEAAEGRLPRCPHGRPLWTELGREELFRAVRRIE